ncbi:PTS sugar transporter subunit IIA [Cetobacterium sp.]|uniref:PTS sugar transporter subunit IIA n=1 Tax=Cetobacterium sp. TaxID=2071632 RepID=UPI003F2E6101
MVYKIGNFLSKLIFKNIFLFITLGIIRWIQIYIPALTIYGQYFEAYILPLSLAFTAGNIIKKDNGGNIALVAMSFLIFLSSSSSIIQGIITGIFAGILAKYIDIAIKKYIYNGLQMFLCNFLYLLTSISTGMTMFLILNYTNTYFNFIPSTLIRTFNNFYGLILITPILEISKVFFFNNIFNLGLLSILGYSDLGNNGKSLLFLLETNPGPGLGVLLGIFLTNSKKYGKTNLVSNIFVQAIGGIHEVYFPYVLKNLKLLWAVSLGGIAGNTIFYIFDSGLIGVSSPGSILNILLLSKPEDKLYIFLGFWLSTSISLLITCLLLKEKDLVENSFENIQNFEIYNLNNIKKIVFLCDAGMGSSNIGANILKSILSKTKYSNINISNTFIGDSIDADLIITHSKLKNRVKASYTNITTIFVEDFFNREFYIETFLKNECLELHTTLSLKSTSRDEALKALGDDLENLGFVQEGYSDSLIERENSCSTYIGNGVSIPHGTHSSLNLIKRNGVIIHHYPYGINFDDETVYILIGITIKEPDSRLSYIANIATIIENEDLVENLILSDNKEDFKRAFNGGFYVK